MNFDPGQVREAFLGDEIVTRISRRLGHESVRVGAVAFAWGVDTETNRSIRNVATERIAMANELLVSQQACSPGVGADIAEGSALVTCGHRQNVYVDTYGFAFAAFALLDTLKIRCIEVLAAAPQRADIERAANDVNVNVSLVSVNWSYERGDPHWQISSAAAYRIARTIKPVALRVVPGALLNRSTVHDTPTALHFHPHVYDPEARIPEATIDLTDPRVPDATIDLTERRPALVSATSTDRQTNRARWGRTLPPRLDDVGLPDDVHDVELLPGDLVFARSEANPLARLITHLDGYWSHVGIYVGKVDGVPTIVHVQHDGVKEGSLEAVCDGGGYVRVDAARPSPLVDNPTAGLAVAREALRLAGEEPTGYDSSGAGLACSVLLRAGEKSLITIAESLRWVPEGRDSSVDVSKYTCSGFVWQVFKRSGLELPLSPPPGVQITGNTVQIHTPDSLIAALRSESGVDPDEELLQPEANRLGRPRSLLQMAAIAFPTAFKATRHNATVPLVQAVTPGDIYMATDHRMRWHLSERPYTAESARSGSPLYPVPHLRGLINRSRFVGRIHVEGGRSNGTGFVIDGGELVDGWRGTPLFVTSAHVRDGRDRLNVFFANLDDRIDAASQPREVPVQFLWQSTNLDVAVFQFHAVKPPQLANSPLQAADRTDLDLTRVVISHPSGRSTEISGATQAPTEDLDLAWGLTSHLASTEPGSSGAPVLDGYLRVVAVHAGGADQHNVNVAVPISAVRGQLTAAESRLEKPTPWSPQASALASTRSLLGAIAVVLLVIPGCWNFVASAIGERVIATAETTPLSAVLWTLVTFTPVGWAAMLIAQLHDRSQRPYGRAIGAFVAGVFFGTLLYHGIGIARIQGVRGVIEQANLDVVSSQILHSVTWSALHTIPGALMALLALGDLVNVSGERGRSWTSILAVVGIPIVAVVGPISLFIAAFPGARDGVDSLRGIASATLLRASLLVCLPLLWRRPTAGLAALARPLRVAWDVALGRRLLSPPEVA